ncbi:hypothetical protein ABIF68_010332 [Bradyrhizobium japonicum]|uniref:hypothetical protein n=1 Tax=Bradyrhizobium japonicum TaxID=375 RepID=UPI0004B3F034|nr:hypothetical protein [Bradyrhizobium japonicum]
MKNPFDAYTMKARLVPAIIAGAPAFAFVAIFVSWGKFGLTHAIASTALTVLFAAFADVARRRGKAIEPKLIERMGGQPTTTTLRHRDGTYDDDTKAAFHAFIAAKLAKPAPTREEEAADHAGADNYYARGATWLRENTRDAKKFDILLNENISYGFRRNLLGLKLPGFLLNAVIVAVCLAIFWQRRPVDLSNTFDAKLLAVVVIAVLHAIYLALFVTESGVFEAARTYARQLLLCTQSPHLGGVPKPRSAVARKSPRRRASGEETDREATTVTSGAEKLS